MNILIPDAEEIGLCFGVLHCLHEIDNVNVYALSSEDNTLKYTRYLKKLVLYKKQNIEEFNFVSIIENAVENFKIDLVIPVSDSGNLLLIRNKHVFSFKNKIILLPNIETYEVSTNKYLLYKHLVNNNIPCPLTIIYNKSLDLEGLTFPIIIKPLKESHGGSGIKKFESITEFNNYIESSKINNDFIIQNYINGYDIDSSVLCENGEILAYTIQKGNMNGETDFSAQIGVDFLYEKQIHETVKHLMKSLNWNGIAHIDLRYDSKDNNFKVIEINARYWQSLEGSLVAGINFPKLHILTNQGIKFPIPKYKQIKYLSDEGFYKKIKNDKSYLFKFKFLWHNTNLKYDLKDPIMIIYSCYLFFLNVFRKVKKS
ncbi:ATP-grasp domain-containing protein [Seonamhaeicola sp. MEBiC1930]|uniref:ATP-grasp domain-containing protein n=1 Tax=Seonamhaeicola sp. MEBiC01930 TaxID=2976768 RepID=UPI00324A163A